MPSIGLVAPFFPPEIGGASIYCFEFAKGLADAGYEVHVFSVPGAQEHRSYTLHPILTRELATDLDRLDAFDMDLWHSLFFFHAPLALRKSRVFVTGHGDDFFGFRLRFALPLNQWLERIVLWRLPDGLQACVRKLVAPWELRHNEKIFDHAIRQARQIITVSQFSKERLCERFPSAIGKTTVIPPGVAERFFVKRSAALARRRLLTVTRLDEDDRIKNVHGVINALAGLKQDYDFQYDIVAGDQKGGYRQEIDELIAKHGLGNRVQIHGRAPLDELVQKYRNADLFVLVSYSEPKNFEGFGIVFLEANACGTPVLTSRDGGMSDYVEEGVNGFYVDDTSTGGIQKALKRFFDGQITFDPCEVSGRPRAYRWSSVTRQIIDTYQRYEA
jgi:phosphatidylinositol alpha-1,6-mannosyltransferase